MCIGEGETVCQSQKSVTEEPINGNFDGSDHRRHTHTGLQRRSTCHFSHCLCVRTCVCACMCVCASVHAEMRGSTDPERIGTIGREGAMGV